MITITGLVIHLATILWCAGNLRATAEGRTALAVRQPSAADDHGSVWKQRTGGSTPGIDLAAIGCNERYKERDHDDDNRPNGNPPRCPLWARISLRPPPCAMEDVISCKTAIKEHSIVEGNQQPTIPLCCSPRGSDARQS
jgi:hypothetical protein